MGPSRFVPTFPQTLRILRFLLALIVAGVLGTAYKHAENWSSSIKRAGGLMMFTAVVTLLYDIYALLFSVDIRMHDCTYSKRYKLIHMQIEGFLTVFWWASLGAVAAALEGMLIDVNGNLLARRWAQNDGSWKPDTTTNPQTQTKTSESTDNQMAVYVKSKEIVVGSVACAGFTGACSTIIWMIICSRAVLR
ncbi:hypothetical protein L211DRAFT_831967 [Terfezia boudieri ATCC MYA-4762]|uniref:MARVEL domain-containing protein n=1 Tax=Terfezia boudieri ATCC MYA-4762 TaxID=1051890 RepID=A0A3N4MAR6_9PEZI|nr:hypothetical protein L211DRAFT_831967 [Terfezia boudieri ATCC MYA-4762]